MKYAEVSVNAPAAQRQTFSYSIPSELSVDVGQAVYVPFGQKIVQGIVIELADVPAFEPTRDISGVIDYQPLLSAKQVLLAKWLSEYYVSPLFDAVALMLPPGFERRVLTTVSLIQQPTDTSSLTENQQHLLQSLSQKPSVKISEIETLLGKKRASITVSQLVEAGFVERTYAFEPVKVKTQQVPYVHLIISAEEALVISVNLPDRSRKQTALLTLLATQSGPISVSEAKLKTNCDMAAINIIVRKGLAVIENIEVKRAPLSRYQVQLSQPLNLTDAQEAVFKPILAGLRRETPDAKPSVFLLHGVTASGKTEIYLQALAEAIKLGKKGIALVPEIALTPQTIERFRGVGELLGNGPRLAGPRDGVAAESDDQRFRHGYASYSISASAMVSAMMALAVCSRFSASA